MLGTCSGCGGPFDSTAIGSSVVRQRLAGEMRIEILRLCVACTAKRCAQRLPSNGDSRRPDAPEHINRFSR